MFIEALTQLAIVHQHYGEKGEFLVDEKTHNDTLTIIESSSRLLMNDLQFKEAHPGPWIFGLGENKKLTIIPPDMSGEYYYAAILAIGEDIRTFKFESLLGLINVFKESFQNETKA